MEERTDRLEARLFGSFELRIDDEVVEHFPTRYCVLLLARLIVVPRPHTRDELTALLWPDADDRTGRRRLSNTVWQIRQTLPENANLLVADRETLAIDASKVASDVGAFRQASAEEALELYSAEAEFLTGYYEEWVLAERDRLQQEYLTALGGSIERSEQARDWETVLAHAQRMLAIDPLREETHQSVIRALLAMGKPSAARRRLRDLRELLDRELGIEPSEETQLLFRNVAPTPPISPLRVKPLPASLTTFRGREGELRELNALFADSSVRLVTLMGIGGIGKTRLALEFARERSPQVAFVSLADVHEARLVPEAIADAITQSHDLSPAQRVADALSIADEGGEEPFLLVIDNAEHVAEATAEFVGELLARVPRLRVLVTSQRSLHLGGERVFALTPLALSESGHAPAASVQLFLDRAQSVRPDFPATPANIADVSQLCVQLEGLPLAIELCAGWSQTLTAKQMLQMLPQRFELLVSRRGDLPLRHQTLRAAIEYSYRQLPPDLQQLFVRLSVFQDGWDLEAAAQVALQGSLPAAIAAMARLTEHSLILAEESHSGGGMRYRMLESLREFAAERRASSADPEIEEAHTAYFVALAERAAWVESSTTEGISPRKILEERSNIRAVIERLISGGEVERAWTLGLLLVRRTYNHFSYRERGHWIERMLAMESLEASRASEIHLRLRAELLNQFASALYYNGDFAESRLRIEQAASLWEAVGDVKGIATSMAIAAVGASSLGNLAQAREELHEALRLAEEADMQSLAARVRNELGILALAENNLDTAAGFFGRSLEGAQRLHLESLRTVCLSNLGLVERYRGNYEAAREYQLAALSISEVYPYSPFLQAFRINLATIARLEGDYVEAVEYLEPAIQGSLAAGQLRTRVWCVKEMGHVAIGLGLYTLGLRLLASALENAHRIGTNFKPIGDEEIQADRQAVAAILGEANENAIWISSGGESPERLIAEARRALLARIAQNGDEIAR